jgi:hypothetical protein
MLWQNWLVLTIDQNLYACSVVDVWAKNPSLEEVISKGEKINLRHRIYSERTGSCSYRCVGVLDHQGLI